MVRHILADSIVLNNIESLLEDLPKQMAWGGEQRVKKRKKKKTISGGKQSFSSAELAFVFNVI